MKLYYIYKFIFLLFGSGLLLLIYFLIFVVIYLSCLFFTDYTRSLLFSAIVISFIIFVHVYFSPYIYEDILKKLDFHYINLEDLPPSVKIFIENILSKVGIKKPLIGIIETSEPLIFTSSFFSETKIIISRGLLEILNEEELKAVLAHECGHIFFGDQELMILFVTLVGLPIYKFLIYFSWGCLWIMSLISELYIRKKHKRYAYKKYAYKLKILNWEKKYIELTGREPSTNLLLIAVIAIFYLVLYFMYIYLALYFSRIREWHADRFSAYLTQNPEALATALLKITYSSSMKNIENSLLYLLNIVGTNHLETLKLGFLNAEFDVSKLENFGITDIITNPTIINLLKWYLFNPWGKILESFSTHPSIIKRIKNLYNVAKELNAPFNINIPPNEKPYSFLKFILELFIDNITIISFIVAIVFGEILFYSFNISTSFIIPLTLAFMSLGSLFKCTFVYRNNNFKEQKIKDLLSLTNVSPLSGIPAIIKGKIIMYHGNDIYIFEDDTGIIFIYDKIGKLTTTFLALGIGNARSESTEILMELKDKNVQIKGYFRRKDFPYFEIMEIKEILYESNKLEIYEESKVYELNFKKSWLKLVTKTFITACVIGSLFFWYIYVFLAQY